MDTKTALVAVALVLGASALVTRGRLALAILAAALFTVLAILAVEINAGWMTSLDDSVWNWFYRHRFHQLRVDSQGIFNYIGQPVPFAVAGVISGTLVALLSRSAMRAVVVIGGVGVGVAVEETLKAVVVRTPANLAKLHDGSLLEYTHSFPSGHVTARRALNNRRASLAWRLELGKWVSCKAWSGRIGSCWMLRRLSVILWCRAVCSRFWLLIVWICLATTSSRTCSRQGRGGRRSRGR